MNNVLIISGTTASGKSDLAIALAKKYNGEIISADSVAVYRQCTIGSAKPTSEQRMDVPHHLIDILDYREAYHVKAFQERSRRCIEEIVSRGKLPIVVGGTGLYIRAMLYDYQFRDETDHQEGSELSSDELIRLIHDKNPLILEKIHPNNRKRLIRAWARLQSGEPEAISMNEPLYSALMYICCPEREMLYQRINNRVDRMIKDGLVDEVKGLITSDRDWNLVSMQAIGYREFRPFFEGVATLDETINLIKKDTRNFAKRQITWFKHQSEGIWVDPIRDGVQEIYSGIEDWLNQSGG